MLYSKVASIAYHVPSRVLSNQDLEAMVDTNDEWIRTRTGIHQRHVAEPGEKTSDLACEAARKALNNAGLRPEDIDLIILATITPDHFCMPSTACEVQRKLGATRAAAFDLQAACTGFIYAMKVADSMIRAAGYQRVLVIGAETLSSITDWTDRGTCILFSDGAGAAVLVPSQEPGVQSCILHSDGNYGDMLMTPRVNSDTPFAERSRGGDVGFIQMRGNELFKVAVKNMSDVLQEALEASGVNEKDISLVIPHQANIRIIEAVAKRFGLSMDRVMVTVDRYGNNSAATIPIAWAEALEQGKIQTGDTIALTAFGGGLTWGSAIVTI
ncbi:ketoacyl-ACP synthase III [Desulfurispirillum indicum]|uniref:beta-ketoacyl-ACP synthase III n=1 Tax=Desulfurispirillum indicum TaxID=936456 RepID=UPI0002F1E145|nr:beta-ketoacyl-ACP synthase III [Desulfurispirillum indicum]UCZ57226.1 ketoacyl-ACP synthase III [Desulfurispirillum indicum]